MPAVSRPCRRCAELEDRFRDPRLRDADGATRYVLVSHLIRDHGQTAGPMPGCETCVRWADTPGIAPDLAARWSLHHYMSHHIPTGRTPIPEEDQSDDNFFADLHAHGQTATDRELRPQ